MPTMPEDKNLIAKQIEVQKQRNAAANSNLVAGQLDAAANTFYDDIMKNVRTDRASRGVSKMAADMGTTAGQLAQDPMDIRERTRGIVDPESVNSITKSSRASNLDTIATQGAQAEYNQGSLAEIIQAGANQLKAKAERMRAEADQTMSTADALMETLTFEQSEKKREFDEWSTREQLRQSGVRGGGDGGLSPSDKEGDASAWASKFGATLDDASQDDFWADYMTLRDNGYASTEIQTILQSRYGSKVKKPETPAEAGRLSKLFSGLFSKPQTKPSPTGSIVGPLGPMLITPQNKGDKYY